MSEHDLEDVVEIMVISIADSSLPVLRKRSLIYKAFEMESLGDCGFTKLRTIDKMVECNYTFLFHREEMYDYNERRAFYDSFETEWDNWPEGNDVYAYENYENENESEKNGMVCVDSGTKSWKEMVSRGCISGAGTEELEKISNYDAIKQISKLLDRKEFEDNYFLYAFSKCVIYSGVYQELDEKDCMEIFGMDKETLEGKFSLD